MSSSVDTFIAIKTALECYESPPSALALVTAIVENRDLTDDEVQNFYGSSESWCDEEVNRLLKLSTPEQQHALMRELLMIAVEDTNYGRAGNPI